MAKKARAQGGGKKRPRAVTIEPDELRKVRLTILRMTQPQLADKLGVTTMTVWRWEAGITTCAPKYSRAIRLLERDVISSIDPAAIDAELATVHQFDTHREWLRALTELHATGPVYANSPLFIGLLQEGEMILDQLLEVVNAPGNLDSFSAENTDRNRVIVDASKHWEAVARTWAEASGALRQTKAQKGKKR